jgi:hypothetical protein
MIETHNLKNHFHSRYYYGAECGQYGVVPSTYVDEVKVAGEEEQGQGQPQEIFDEA